MGWSIGYDNSWDRDIGYGVPAICDHPKCDEKIDRGLSYCCGGYVTDYGCGLYFCSDHLKYRTPRGSDRMVELCPRCIGYRRPYKPKADTLEWIKHKLTDDSWHQWREANPVKRLSLSLELSKIATPPIKHKEEK